MSEYEQVEQKSDEWLALRRGRITASGVYELMKSGRGKNEVLGVTAMSYLMKRFASGLVDYEPDIKSVAMEWGNIHEANARDAYVEKLRKIFGDHMDVEEIGFATVKGYEELAGSSPDGVVIQYLEDADNIVTGCIEIKCPFDSSVHVETLLNKAIPKYYQDKYYAQCQMNILTTGTQWCDFISYDPRMTNPDHRLVIVRIKRDEDFIADLTMRLGLAQELFNEWREKL